MDDDEASWRWIRGGPGEMGLKSNLKGECGQYIYIYTGIMHVKDQLLSLCGWYVCGPICWWNTPMTTSYIPGKHSPSTGICIYVLYIYIHIIYIYISTVEFYLYV